MILQCEAPKIAKLVYNSNNYGLWYANNELLTGANLNQRSHHNGGAHIVDLYGYHWLPSGKLT
jgi:hypothetical protein